MRNAFLNLISKLPVTADQVLSVHLIRFEIYGLHSDAEIEEQKHEQHESNGAKDKFGQQRNARDDADRNREREQERENQELQETVFSATMQAVSGSQQAILNLQTDVKTLIQDQIVLDVDMKGLRVDQSV